MLKPSQEVTSSCARARGAPVGLDARQSAPEHLSSNCLLLSCPPNDLRPPRFQPEGTTSSPQALESSSSRNGTLPEAFAHAVSTTETVPEVGAQPSRDSAPASIAVRSKRPFPDPRSNASTDATTRGDHGHPPQTFLISDPQQRRFSELRGLLVPDLPVRRPAYTRFRGFANGLEKISVILNLRRICGL